jgi:hypothetical protein
MTDARTAARTFLADAWDASRQLPGKWLDDSLDAAWTASRIANRMPTQTPRVRQNKLRRDLLRGLQRQLPGYFRAIAPAIVRAVAGIT